MLDILKQTFFTGVGVVALTKDKVQELTNELVRRGEITQKQGEDFVDEVLSKSRQAETEFSKQIEVGLKTTLDGLHVAKKDDLDDLTKKIDLLMVKIEQLENRLSEGSSVGAS